MTTVKHPDTLLSYIQGLEQRIATLEGQARLQAARISSGQLNVGAAGGANQIEIDSANQRVRFDAAGGPPTDLLAWGGGGAALIATGTVGTVPAQTLTWNGGYFATNQVNRVNPDTSVTNVSEVYADVQDSGGGLYRGDVALTARGTDHDGSQISLWSDGGVAVYSNARATDPPAPPADWVLLYVKAQRLYYKDSANVVHGPL